MVVCHKLFIADCKCIFLCFCCIRFHRINSPFAGSILTTESVAVYTSTSPSQHNYSIQKFVPKIRCTCVGVYACAPMQFSLSLTVSLCLMLTLLSSFVRVTLQFQFDRITRFSCFLYLCLCFICSRFYALFFLFSIGISGDAFLL